MIEVMMIVVMEVVETKAEAREETKSKWGK
jgi:hypothetical protein